jgi:hypothetical protein
MFVSVLEPDQPTEPASNPSIEYQKSQKKKKNSIKVRFFFSDI